MIQPIYATLKTIFADRVFRVPAYQRFYSWRTRQREDLFSDLEKLVQEPEDQHFMGTLVCYRTKETQTVGTAEFRVYDVVDGQQRLTTLILMLKCIQRVLTNEDYRKDLDRLLVKKDGHLILLQTNNANSHIFNSFIQTGQPPSEDDLTTASDRNFRDAIRACQQFVEDWAAKEKTEVLTRLILHRLGFVLYDVEDPRVVYTLFEVLNSRGLVVDWLDKTKSVLMGKTYQLSGSQLAADAAIANLQSVWTQVYQELAKKDVSGDEVLRVTATLYYGAGAGKPRAAEDSLDLLRKKCTAATSAAEIAERLLKATQKVIRLLEMPRLDPVTEILQARVLGAAVLLAQGLNEDERRKLLNQWERVTFRIFGLHGKDARTMVGPYVTLAHKIVVGDLETQTYNQIMQALRELGQKYAIDTAVNEGLVRQDCYGRSPGFCRYVLWNYEEHLARQAGKNATVNAPERDLIWQADASDSVEHIFPRRNAGKTWQGHVGRIGNLVLLPPKVNAACGAKPFAKKKKIYRQCMLWMLKPIVDKQHWALKDVEEREDQIVGWAKTRWCDV